VRILFKALPHVRSSNLFGKNVGLAIAIFASSWAANPTFLNGESVD